MLTLLEKFIADSFAPAFADRPFTARVTDVCALESNLKDEMAVIKPREIEVIIGHVFLQDTDYWLAE